MNKYLAGWLEFKLKYEG